MWRQLQLPFDAASFNRFKYTLTFAHPLTRGHRNISHFSALTRVHTDTTLCTQVRKMLPRELRRERPLQISICDTFTGPARSPVPRARPARTHTPAADTSAPTRAWVSRRGGRPVGPLQTDTRSDGACSLFHRSPGTGVISMQRSSGFSPALHFLEIKSVGIQGQNITKLLGFGGRII